MAQLIFIDDNIVDHRIFQYLAEKFDSTAGITYSVRPDSIIDYLKQHQTQPQFLPDIILVDLRMRGFDGYDFLKSYSELRHNLDKEIRIYVISFSIHPRDLNLLIEYPFVRQYLMKPLTEDNLKDILALA